WPQNNERDSWDPQRRPARGQRSSPGRWSAASGHQRSPMTWAPVASPPHCCRWQELMRVVSASASVASWLVEHDWAQTAARRKVTSTTDFGQKNSRMRLLLILRINMYTGI